MFSYYSILHRFIDLTHRIIMLTCYSDLLFVSVKVTEGPVYHCRRQRKQHFNNSNSNDSQLLACCLVWVKRFVSAKNFPNFPKDHSICDYRGSHYFRIDAIESWYKWYYQRKLVIFDFSVSVFLYVDYLSLFVIKLEQNTSPPRTR